MTALQLYQCFYLNLLQLQAQKQRDLNNQLNALKNREAELEKANKLKKEALDKDKKLIFLYFHISHFYI